MTSLAVKKNTAKTKMILTLQGILLLQNSFTEKIFCILSDGSVNGITDFYF